jgi:hypothetical protein
MKLELKLNDLTYNMETPNGDDMMMCTTFIWNLFNELPEKIILTLSLEREEGFTEARRMYYDVVQTGHRMYGLYFGLADELAKLIGNQREECDFYFKIEQA